MAKKKRKNKAAHARVPHPSERRQVVSYDDIEQTPAPPVPRQKVSYASDSNSDDDDDDGDGDGQVPENRHEVLSQEKLRERERPQTDVTYGQIGAFPGLDPRDKTPFYGPANDGLDYLRMVRSEARQIPHIVTAPSPPEDQRDDQEDGYGYEDDQDDYDADSQGWYEDGAYVARSVNALSPDDEEPSLDPQQVYYDSLRARFQNLRQTLRASPSVQAVQSLGHRHPISFPTGNRNAQVAATKEWKGHLQSTVPLPAQLASMDQHTVLHVLKLAEGQLENCRSTNIPHNLGLWMWALLARLEDVGLLQTRDVSVVRDLAKMAVWVRMMHGRALDGRPGDFDDYDADEDAYEDDGEKGAEIDGEKNTNTAGETVPGTEENEAGSSVKDEPAIDTSAIDLDSANDLSETIAAKKRELMAEEEEEQQNEPEEFPDLNTRVTIDMAVIIAGEFYGQKDLLHAILPWDTPAD